MFKQELIDNVMSICYYKRWIIEITTLFKGKFNI